MSNKKNNKKPWYKVLYMQVLVAVIIGIALGIFYPQLAQQMEPFGKGFIKLIKMTIAPIIFCTVVMGIAGMDNMRNVGKTGGIALLYFEVMSTVALILGLIIVNVLKPGQGMNIDPNSLDEIASIQGKKLETVPEFFLNIIPDTFVGAFAGGQILQVLFVAVIFGFVLQRHGGKENLIFIQIEKFSEIMFGIVGVIMKVAPIGAFGAMAFTIGKHGVSSLLNLAQLMGVFYLTCLIFIFVILGIVCRIRGFSVFKLVRYIKDELLIVLGTSSSESVLPRMMIKMEKLGVKKSCVGLVLPTGYSFNLDGTSIYLTMAAIFVAQATNAPISIYEQILLLAVLFVTSKGAAGVTGSGFIVLAATIDTVGAIPAAGLGIIYGIDRFMSEARALTNLVGNAVATVVVGSFTGELDKKQLHKVLNDPKSVSLDKI
ncbi:dicarboxylate/amino acid:cation symporter [Thorsellia anophelis]|uniref:Aerobic C4-dicarboxylate transport protein n=1 Tax=Thorsellia anophelis DSM 18579 TaxID=1123402 RepID=A0A1I0D1Z9_9GAMM|nr:dicarboxylate/amino acid:cation symporter [Thorsellia anophelis]SET26113.1 aerobic C4-dicarboxylate transport protein [Thorsellia anophelis DSM 18579]